MTPGQFLRQIWPDQGFYCIAHPFTPKGTTLQLYSHKVFATISEAVTHVHEQAHSQDVYLACLSLREERVWDPDKEDKKTGAKGAWAVRKQGNMLAGKSLFWDLDVGKEAHKYDNQRELLAALIDFITKTRMPMPTLVSSGGGVHVWWPFDQTLPAAELKTFQLNLRQLGEALGMKVDPMRTTDMTSVLRVPDTFNWKDRANPRPVKVLQEGAITPLATLRQIVSDALISAGVVAQQAPAPHAMAPRAENHGLAPQVFNDFGPPPTLEEVGDACAQVREILGSQLKRDHPHYGQLDNTAWYRGMLGVLKHVENGPDLCRQLTALHPRDNAQIEAKLVQLEKYPPARCDTLQSVMPWKDTPCQSCKFRNDPSVPNPLAAARKTTLAPQPTLALSTPPAPPAGANASGAPSAPPLPPAASAGAPPPAPSAGGSVPPTGSSTPPNLVTPSPALQSILVPNPPKPYERLKTGGIAITKTDKDGNESSSIILSHDLYPVKRLVNKEVGQEQQTWRTTLPRSGSREFTIDADVLYDSRKFAASLSHNGIYPHKADLPALQDYMVAYISQLQRDLDADSQSTHLGWADEFRQFVLPDKTLHSDGTVKASALTTATRNAAQFITKKGTLQAQVALMGFYAGPEYIPNQFAVLASLASIIFHATGQHGVVINMSGESGASKSTTLYTAASLWGDPMLWPINGTNRGATANARAQRVATNANLPTPVDEITHIPVKEAQDLVMNITQPGHRLRLQTDGSERKVTDNYKSAIMIATANSSLHNLLSVDNAAGTAGSMRVFEMKMLAQRVHTKAEADEFLRQLNLNYGHIGEVFAQFVIAHLPQVEARVQQLIREIDVEANITSAERFWSAVIAAVLVAGEIANALGLLPYDVDAIRNWAVKHQIPYMRGVVSEEYRTPLAVLTDYIAEKNGNIVVIDKSTTIGANTGGVSVAGSTAFALNRPNNALVGHYDMKLGVLYLLKQAFKEHCTRIGASSTRIIDELHQPRSQGTEPPRRVIIERNKRRTLGAGTDLAKGQNWCFAVDMTHPEISGAVPVTTVSNDTVTPTAPTGNLKAVT